MKTMKIVLAIALAVALLSGCAKENVNDKAATESAVQAGGSRTIAVSFAPQTKTALGEDGLTPEFQAGYDTIKVAKKDGSASPEDCPVYIENEVAVIHTDLEGDLVAVYPSSAASIDGNVINGVRVSSKQTGKFADANICSAFIPAGSQSASFENETAILKFYVDKSIGVSSITITDKGDVADGSSSITVEAEDETSILSEINKGASNERICYVAVLDGSHPALNFSSVTTTQGPPVQKQLQEITLDAGTMYNVFLPYYIEVNGQKWGYCNIGAFLPEEYGDFFVWGGTEGHRAKPSTASFEDSFSFHKGSFPESLENGCSSYISKVCQNDILLPAYDAANVVWKGNWRMPTQEEAKQLVNLGSQYVDGKFKGWRISDTELFLPATGYGTNDYISFPGEAARYWTSSFKDSNSMYAWTLILSDTPSADVNVHEIYWGCPIRPIYGDLVPDTPTDALKGVFTVSDGGTPDDPSDDVKVHFSRGNLYCSRTSSESSDWGWHFYEKQHQFKSDYPIKEETEMRFATDGDTAIDLFTWGYSSSTSLSPTGKNYVTGHKVDDDKLVYDKPSSEGGDDWGVAYCESNDIPVGTWRTLTTWEWRYLVDTKRMKNVDFSYSDYTGGVYIENTYYKGVFFYPDNYIGEEVSSSLTWNAINAAGIVFLPAAGYRRDGSDLGSPGGLICFYWSASSCNDIEKAYDVFFRGYDIGTYYTQYRSFGCSVRLVKNISTAE